MTLRELQEKTDVWIKGNGGYWSEFEILARMTEELGEISSDLQREKGLRPRKQKTDVAGEVGDLLFTLAVFANRKNIDLEKVSEQVFAKYQVRDAEDWGKTTRTKSDSDKQSSSTQ